MEDTRLTYQLPHPLDRPHQAEVLEWILESPKQFLILSAPTGFGKSPLPAATSIDFKTLVLVQHKSLQSTNYEGSYNFPILYGKSNYPCENPPNKNQIAIPGIGKLPYTAYDCEEEDCLCPYQLAIAKCLRSNRVSLNYAKFLVSQEFVKYYGPEFLFLDEGHNLPEIITEFVGITLDYDNEFLQLIGDVKPLYESVLNYNDAMAIFRQLARACESNKPEQEKDLIRWRKWKRLHTKIAITDKILQTSSLDDWYYETTKKHLLVKPLTAKYHFKKLFDVADKIILMSATIGPSIASRLGLDENEYDFMEVPSMWPAPTRLVYDLGAPLMNWKNRQKPEVREKQAKLIASVLDRSKSGIIHTMSKAQSYELFDLLKCEYGYQFFIPEIGIGTEKQLESWYDYRRPGTYCISWSFHEGVDLGSDDINVMAKTPYASLASNYDKAKRDYDVGWYLEKAAQTMEQIFGRHQRGIASHYGGNKLAFIADGSWRRLESRLSKDFRSRIRNYRGRRVLEAS
jgi:Rad3-related DNA helicase